MFRYRFLILLGVGFLAASAALADDIGFVDCSSHSDGIQVFAKPRKTPDVLATVPCGERFTVLVYGFVFSQVQTRDGRVGFVYSNMIAIDRNLTSIQQAGSLQVASARTKVPSAPPAAAVTPNPPAPAQSQLVAAQPAPAPAVEPAPNVPQPVAAAQSAPSAPAESQSSALFPTPAPVADAASTVPATTATAAPATQPVPEPPQPAPVQPAPAPAAVPESKVTETTAPVTQPEPSPAAAQPQPASPEPAPAPIRPKNERASWEKPNSAIRKPTLFEFYGGYAFARMGASGGGTTSNLNGGMGSVGLTLRPWLQIVADSTYNYMTATGSKTVLYGNHFGGRYFYRSRNRWSATPFVEGLVGGSRVDTTITGTGGYTASQNCLSYKVGGGLDIQPTRHWEIRVIDVDYYRTAFGTNLHQTNYWVTTGVVLHLFGGSR
jgi:opacity protein-like surface antigen